MNEGSQRLMLRRQYFALRVNAGYQVAAVVWNREMHLDLRMREGRLNGASQLLHALAG